MFRQLSDFIEDWSYERAVTSRTLETLTNEALDQRVCAEGRTARDLAWHLVLAHGGPAPPVGARR